MVPELDLAAPPPPDGGKNTRGGLKPLARALGTSSCVVKAARMASDKCAPPVAHASKMNRGVTFNLCSIDSKFESRGGRQVIGIVGRSAAPLRAAAADGGG